MNLFNSLASRTSIGLNPSMAKKNIGMFQNTYMTLENESNIDKSYRAQMMMEMQTQRSKFGANHTRYRSIGHESSRATPAELSGFKA